MMVMITPNPSLPGWFSTFSHWWPGASPVLALDWILFFFSPLGTLSLLVHTPRPYLGILADMLIAESSKQLLPLIRRTQHLDLYFLVTCFPYFCSSKASSLRGTEGFFHLACSECLSIDASRHRLGSSSRGVAAGTLKRLDDPRGLSPPHRPRPPPPFKNSFRVWPFLYFLTNFSLQRFIFLLN